MTDRPNMQYPDGHIGPMDDATFAQWTRDVAVAHVISPDAQASAILSRKRATLEKSADHGDQIEALKIRLQLAGIP